MRCCVAVRIASGPIARRTAAVRATIATTAQTSVLRVANIDELLGDGAVQAGVRSDDVLLGDDRLLLGLGARPGDALRRRFATLRLVFLLHFVDDLSTRRRRDDGGRNGAQRGGYQRVAEVLRRW